MVNAQIAGVVGQNAVENNELDLIQLISPASAAMLSKDAKHREAMKIAHQIRMASSAITIVQVGGGYAIAGVGLVAPEAIGAVYSACRVNPAGCTVVTVESADILAGVATGAVTVSNLPASAIKSTSKIGGKYAEEISKNATKNINPILKLGETKVINEVSVTRVGRWMSPEELRQMQSTGKIVQGGGGQTFISINGVNDFKGAAPKGSVYVEFDVPTNSLIQGGKNGWYKMLGPDANASQKHLLNKRGGALLPDVNNIKIIDKK